MRREAVFERVARKGQIMVAKMRGIRVLGIYSSPRALSADQVELDACVRRVQRKGERTAVCEDLNVRHTR